MESGVGGEVIRGLGGGEWRGDTGSEEGRWSGDMGSKVGGEVIRVVGWRGDPGSGGWVER